MKVIGFDLVGVLVKEISFELDDVQDKMERLFGKNKSDSEYENIIRDKISNKVDIEENIKYIIDNIYQVRFPNLIHELKNKFPNTIIIIATNHVSYIRNYIESNFDMNLIDRIYVSAEMNEIKPDIKFYQYILNDLNIKASDLLFLDDNDENIDGARKLGINTIKINKDSDILEAIIDFNNMNN